uniref:Putative RNA editing complex protein MP46,mitochondrial n=1 Tax=Leishmania guyanensis TaxID=5670 RepID=A0A1E1J4X7_LEIGU|nr:Putative RNA editing complex protein MP46,mitochondrial [Leishmania guyanensis]
MIPLRMRFDGYRRATTSTASWYCLTPARCRTTMPESAYAGSCEPELCLLCDTPYTSWTAHTREHAHVARSVVCRFFVMPERSESIMQHLERHIALDLKEVDALTARKVERRRERLLAGLVHLVEKGVLRYSIPTLPPSTPTGGKTGRRRGIGIGGASLEVNLDRFLTCVLVGEAFLRREVLDRCARLIPSLKAVELNSVVAYLTSTRQVARIFDELSLLELLVARAESDKAPESATTVFARVTEPANVEPLSATAGAPSSGSDTSTDASPLPRPSSSMPAATPSSPIRWNLSHEDKAYIMCACLGELHRFHEQERPRSVASKAAADAIVLNVLAGHGRENLVSELVHDTLQRMVDEGTVIWRQHQEDVKRRGLSSEANLTAKNGIGEQSALDMDGRVSEGLRYMRTAPLASKPSPPSASVGALDSAAAERLVSSYLPFKDIDQLGSEENEAVKATTTTPSRSSTDDTCITTPDFIAALHTSAKNWKPLTAELRQRGKDWNRLPFAPSSPKLKVWKKPR